MPKILLADDSTHAQRMGVKILSAEGFEVATVSNGKAAIDSFKKSTPDLVIADVFMPGRNGYEVCQHVKTTEELKHIPVLLIIGAMEPYDPDEGKKAGADGVITKPLESSSLVTTVKGLIDAAKRFAPAKPKKEKVSEETITTTSTATNPYGPVVEDPSWAVAEEIITTTSKPEVIIISQSMGQQAVGMLAEQFESDASTELPALNLGENTQPNLDDQSIDIPMGGESFTPEVAVSSPIGSSFQTNWSAEPASITVEDEKLFEQPAANWSDLTEMALEVSEENDQPTPQPWFTEPGLVQGDTTPVETGTAEGIEHFENLNETISSHAPLSLAALGFGVIPISMSSPANADGSPAMPAGSDEILLSPADVPATTSADSLGLPTEPEFDRGFEPITSAVSINPHTEALTSELAAAAEPTPPHKEVVAAIAPVERDPLVEAAVAMVRAATEKELAADAAAASPGSAATPTIDPSTLEHVIRGVVGELMPQIVAQVKSALKH